LDVSIIFWLRVIRVLFAGVFIAAVVDAVGYRASGDTVMVHVQTHYEAFVNMSIRSACFIDAAFFCEKQSFLSWVYSPQVSDY
jgi:hypothetical protein